MELITILSALGGGLMRIVPEALNFLNKRTDNSHELAMMDKQVALEQQRGKSRTDELAAVHLATMSETELKGSIDQTLGILSLQGEALRGQMQMTGNRIVDGLNFLVRPLTTYYFLGCYGMYKSAMLYAAFQQADMWAAILQSYDGDDRAILSAILGFWFVGRSIEKRV